MSKLVTTLLASLFIAGNAFAQGSPATPAKPAATAAAPAAPGKPTVAPTADTAKKADTKVDSKAGAKKAAPETSKK